MSIRSFLGRSSFVIPVLAAAAFMGCQMDRTVTSDKAAPEAVGSAAEAVVLSSTGQAVTIDPYRTLINVDEELRGSFSFQEVMETLAARSGTPGLTAIKLYQQWWDTNNDVAHARVSAPHALHCTPPETYDMICPRQEGRLAGDENSPFLNGGNTVNGYNLLAAVNRFDLAPPDGAHCGEYRLVFGKNSGKTKPNDRLLISFEAQLPNPNPAAGLDGCKPLAQFWVDLSIEEDPAQRAAAVKSFYLNGLPGFAPVVHPDHYGPLGGAIRTNQFMFQYMAQLWQAREYKMEHWCPEGGFYPEYCSLRVKNVPVANHPNTDFFSGENNDPLAPAARAEFLANLPSLLAPSLDAIKLVNSDIYNPINSDGFLKRNSIAFRMSNFPEFQQAVTDRLAELGSDLTWAQVANRASTQLCEGCHQSNKIADLGGGLFWPPSNTFTHIDDARTEDIVDDVGVTIGTRPLISPAMKSLFLPTRKQVLERYLSIPEIP
jgi:hypothetical protein